MRRAAARSSRCSSTAPGRAYSLLAHTLPSARGQGEPLSGRLDPPDGATFAGVLIGEPADRWVLASSAGYGFIVEARGPAQPQPCRQGGAERAGRLGGRNRDPCRRRRATVSLLAALNSEGRLLVFPVADLPELPRGKGNKIFGISTKKSLVEPEIAARHCHGRRPARRCSVLMGERTWASRTGNSADYRGERGQRGAVLPRGWRKVEGLEVE